MQLVRALLLRPKQKFKSKFTFFIVPIFLILLADSTMGYAFPIIVENSVNNNTMLGLVMSLSSITGLFIDLVLPKILKTRHWYQAFLMGMVISIGFPLATFLGIRNEMIVFFLLASCAWGIYFELIFFSQQDFIISEEKKISFSKDWGIINGIWQVAALIGPIIGFSLLDIAINELLATVMLLQGLAMVIFVIIFFSSKNVEIKRRRKISRLKIIKDFFRDFTIWKILGKKILPVILTGLFYSLVASVFWTIGPIYSEILGSETFPEWLFFVAHTAGLILGAFIIIRLNVRKGKKRLAMFALALGGTFLTLFYFVQNSWLLIILTILTSIFMAFIHPLNEAIYGDYADRSPDFEVHILSLSRIMDSFSYILGPIAVGLFADNFGYKNTFAIFGMLAVTAAIILLLTTPKKIKLPQKVLDKI